MSPRLRGILGTALTWGVALSALATTLLVSGLALGVVPREIFGDREVVALALRGLLVGGVAGALVATVISRTERGSTMATLSSRRMALWGFLGTSALPLVGALAAGVVGVLTVPVVAAACLGAGALGSLLAVSTLRLARRAPAVRLASPDQSRLDR